MNIKAIIGLGNPGQKFVYTRHNIGFRVIDTLADRLSATWRTRDKMEVAEAIINEKKIILIKPQTFMNNSGEVIPFLTKQGIKVDELLVIHDELELPFGKIGFKTGGSAKGHNGLKSIIAHAGDNFHRLRFGIGRPTERTEVPDYVLTRFAEPDHEVEELIAQAVDDILKLY